MPRRARACALTFDLPAPTGMRQMTRSPPGGKGPHLPSHVGPRRDHRPKLGARKLKRPSKPTTSGWRSSTPQTQQLTHFRKSYTRAQRWQLAETSRECAHGMRRSRASNQRATERVKRDNCKLGSFFIRAYTGKNKNTSLPNVLGPCGGRQGHPVEHVLFHGGKNVRHVRAPLRSTEGALVSQQKQDSQESFRRPTQPIIDPPVVAEPINVNPGLMPIRAIPSAENPPPKAGESNLSPLSQVPRSGV